MPFVTKIVSDAWSGAKSANVESSRPAIQDAIDAVNRLDGRTYTQVVLKGDGRSLIIGGGNEGRYNGVLTIGDDEAFYTLVDPRESAEKDVLIVTGGQAGKFPQNQCVSLGVVSTAIREFFECGEPSSVLTWHRE